MVTSSFALPTKPKLPSTKSDPFLTESDQQPVSVLTQPFRSPSFRDLQRSCAYLQGRLADALTANEALTQDNEALRSQQREEAAFMGRLAQDAASAEQSQRTAETRAERESSRLHAADIKCASLVSHNQQLESRLLETNAHEERLIEELAAARADVADARAEVADLRAESADRLALLRQTEDARDQTLSRLNVTEAQLANTQSELAAAIDALNAARAEVQNLNEQCADAAKALQVARLTNSELEDLADDHAQEANDLAGRVNAATMEANAATEARLRAERTAYTLNEQLKLCHEQKAELEAALGKKHEKLEVARGETRTAQGEAHALAIRMGLYRQTLQSDLADLVAREKRKQNARFRAAKKE